jgi:hypothetical protein
VEGKVLVVAKGKIFVVEGKRKMVELDDEVVFEL